MPVRSNPFLVFICTITVGACVISASAQGIFEPVPQPPPDPGRTRVFVCVSSPKTRDATRDRLVRAITNLRSIQAFACVFPAADGSRVVLADGLLLATPDNKRRGFAFCDTLAAVDRAVDPGKALDDDFGWKAQTWNFGLDLDVAEPTAWADRIRELNRDNKAVVNIAVLHANADAPPAEAMEPLRAVAERSGGALRVYGPDDAEALAERNRRFTPLFDGKTLAGWKPIGDGEWKVEDGAIVGRNTKDKDYGHLVSEKSYKDFTARLKFKSVKGNSGLYFRITLAGFSGVSGFQAEIDPKVDVGGLYETNGRAWVSKPTAEQVQTWFKPGEWNEMTVTAKGGDVTVTVNGKVTAELKNDPGKFREGPLALQVHGKQDCEVYFKDIEVAE